MALIHYLLSWVDNVRPVKSSIRAGFRDYVQHCMSAAELRTTSTQGAKFVAISGAPYVLDAGDVSTADNGSQCIVSADGGRYKLATALRDRLTAARTYYVAPTGSDTANGLLAVTPFATVQRALDVIAQVDIGIYDVTISLAPGTYGGGAITGAWLGSGNVTISGDIANPAAYVLSGGGAAALSASRGGRIFARGVRLQGLFGAQANVGGLVRMTGAFEVGACGGQHFRTDGGNIEINANYKVVGSANAHWFANALGSIVCEYRTIEIVGSLTFSYWAYSAQLAQLQVWQNVYTYSGGGAANGAQKYGVLNNAVIITGFSGPNHFPGTVAGTATNGGLYT